MIALIINLLNKILPKFNNKYCISAFPDFDDQTRGMLPFLDKKKVVILLSNGDSMISKPFWVSSDIIVVKKNSIIGIWHLVTSRKVFFTHGIFSFFKIISKSRQEVINIWHGMPLKNIGFLDGKSHFPQSHSMYSTSCFFQGILSNASGLKIDDIEVKGLPRNNILLLPITNPTLLMLREKFNKVIVWLPTYRKTNIGDIRNDGEEKTIYGFENFDEALFNKELISNNICVIIKPHPLSIIKSTSKKYSNILKIDGPWLSDHDLTLYELLGASDSLWTDFSSVFVDYLILKRPVTFVVPDLITYQKNRGLTFEMEKCSQVGRIIETPSDLIKLISEKQVACVSQDLNTVSRFEY